MQEEAKEEACRLLDLWHVQGEWHGLRDLCGGLLDEHDELTLRRCVEGRARSVVVEHQYIDKDYRNAFSGFYSKKFPRISNRTERLHFFDIEVDLADFFTPDLPRCLADKLGVAPSDGETTPGYMGYVVLRPTEYSHIGRCLFDPRRLATKVKGRVEGCLVKYHSHVLGHKLNLWAFPHQSQDTQVASCAETALWSLFRYMSQRYRQYAEKYPHDIALLNDDFSWGRVLPSSGLNVQQIVSMVARFGLDAAVYAGEDTEDDAPPTDSEPSTDSPADADASAASMADDGWATVRTLDKPDAMMQMLHICIDSGLPPILVPPKHAVVAMGVEYQDSPVVARSGARVIPSTDFVSGVIVNDDNFAPYARVDRVTATGEDGEPGYTCTDVDPIICPLPGKVFLTALEAVGAASDLVEQLGSREAILGECAQGVLVRRIVCTSSTNYKEFRQRQPHDGATALLLGLPMPHFLWLAEYYPIELWSARQAVLEVALDATAGNFDLEPYLWIRRPGSLLVNTRRIWGMSSGPEEFWLDKNNWRFPGIAANITPFSR